jgi:hypothetical protein
MRHDRMRRRWWRKGSNHERKSKKVEIPDRMGIEENQTYQLNKKAQKSKQKKEVGERKSFYYVACAVI